MHPTVRKEYANQLYCIMDDHSSCVSSDIYDLKTRIRFLVLRSYGVSFCRKCIHSTGEMDHIMDFCHITSVLYDGLICILIFSTGWILAPKSCMDQSLDMYAHHKNIDSYFLWLLKSYRSVTVHCDSTKTPIKKSIKNSGDSNHQYC